MKKPAIIEPTIEVRIYSHAMMTSPHKVEEFNPNKETEVLYARAMELISDGKPLEGKKFLEEAYDLGSFKAGKALSYGLSVGWFGERDNKSSLIILWNLVERGYPGAMNDIGFAYMHGLGLRKSMRWAIYWFEKSAQGGCPDAMGNLADIYLFSNDKYQNIERGLLYAFMGADLDNEMAMNELGLCYEDGIGMPIDYENAFKWFSKAVENNAGACAEHNLARCYRRGRGTPVNKEKAKELEALAVEHGLTPKTKEQ